MDSIYLDRILEKAINDIAQEMFKNDDCKPQFIVSIGCDKKKEENPDLFCTCIHGKSKVTRLIDFDKYRDDFYSPFNVSQFIEYLYNCTM